MLRRLLVRSHRTTLTSARRPSCHSHRRTRASASISVLALVSVIVVNVALPIPQAEAVHANPSGGEGKFTQVIDWIDWTEMTNTRWENQKRILPDGTTGVYGAQVDAQYPMCEPRLQGVTTPG